MKCVPKLLLLASTPLLLAALGMDEQPSYRAYEAPVLTPPPGAVPVSGKEVVSRRTEPGNPVAASEESVAAGNTLFDINCAMCHGETSSELGRVGRKLIPPPPALAPPLVQALSDAEIFKALTFGFGRMPPFQDRLSPPERWDLVNFLRTRK